MVYDRPWGIEPVAKSIASSDDLTVDRLVLKQLTYSPNHIDGILKDVAIDANDGNILDLTLGDEQSVEGVSVQVWERCNLENVG